MRSWSVFGVGFCALATAGTAPAATTVYYQSGAWRAFSGRDAQNRLVCGMLTDNPDDGRELRISSVIGRAALYFSAEKPTWNIPAAMTIPVVLQSNNEVPWTVQAIGAAHEVSWSLGGADASAFESSFRDGTQMTVSFPSGNEPTWRVVLDGATAVDGTFRRCVRDYTAVSTAASASQQSDQYERLGTRTGQLPESPPPVTSQSPSAFGSSPNTLPALPPIPPASGPAY